MLISLDYDDTYTKSPRFWRVLIDAAAIHGHTVICVTSRDDQNLIPPGLGIPVIYAGPKPKRQAAEQAGYKVDVWIDDMPEAIVDGLPWK